MSLQKLYAHMGLFCHLSTQNFSTESLKLSARSILDKNSINLLQLFACDTQDNKY